MAYNLQSLITILEQILNPEETRWIVTHNKPRLQSLLQKAASLQQNLENISGLTIESLEGRIRDATHKAEDVIERYMVNRLLSRRRGMFGQVFWWRRRMRLSFPKADLQQVVEEFDSAMEQLVKIEMEGKTTMSAGSSSSTDAAFLPLSSKNEVVVGVDEDLLQLKDRLTGHESKLEIVPIVGMGGIGKTTLARTLYEDPLIGYHFDICAWTAISQDYNVRAILLGLLRRQDGKLSNELTECTDNELQDILHKRLYGRRYLIVLDDMWNTDSWDDMQWWFPDNNNGSRIVLTTRASDVAKYVGTQSLQHKVNLLSMSKSWKLLHQIVFGKEDCPDIALEKIGRKIAGDCGGLPLAINVIGGLLSKAERSKDVWEQIANDVSASIAETDNHQLSNVLSLSYNHLPNHLKPCFLYMGAFPEDYQIKASRLIRMWVAEGFLKSNGGKSLEEEAKDYLEALIARNLILVARNRTNGKPLSYGMHDILRDLCTRKAGEEKFVHVKNERDEGTLYKLRRVSVHTSYRMDEDVYEMSFVRSLICTALHMPAEIVSPIFSALRLVRVVDVLGVQFREFPREVLKLVNLRYLAVSCHSGGIPREISRLLNLQTLIAQLHGGHMPSEMWEMSELRHLKLDTLIFIKEGYMKQNMQEKLQTISWMNCDPSIIRMAFFKTIPNIENLGISCKKLSSSEVVDLSHLHKLQTLRCRSYLPTLRFPYSIRKLTLIDCTMLGRVLTTLCALPDLEVLKLFQCVFENEVFEATEGDVFNSLQILLLEKMDNLVIWRADDTNFPTLQCLAIIDCPLLEKIPSSIGDISTLELIQLYKCSPSLEASAKEIQRVQHDEFDNFDLQLLIYRRTEVV